MTRLQVRVWCSWSPVAARTSVRSSAASACCCMPCACSPLATGRSRAMILHLPPINRRYHLLGFAVTMTPRKWQEARDMTSRGRQLPQYAHAQGTACCAWHSASLHLRGRFLEPILPVCAVLWGDAEGLAAGPTGAAGAMPGGGLWPVQSARLAAASCPRRLSASSELCASSAFSCPAASSRAYAIISLT